MVVAAERRMQISTALPGHSSRELRSDEMSAVPNSDGWNWPYAVEAVAAAVISYMHDLTLASRELGSSFPPCLLKRAKAFMYNATRSV